MLVNIDCNSYVIDYSLFSAVASMAEIVEGIKNTSVNLYICDNETIREYNKKYRNIDLVTDVLSFPSIDYNGKTITECFEKLDEAYDPETNTIFIGDSIISIDKAIYQANEFGHSVKRELAFLFCHSILHLFGYDHIKKEDASIMEAKQKYILDNLAIQRDKNGKVSDKSLVDLAIKSMEKSYIPYSKFPVGACLLGKDGSVFMGCNVENAAYGSTICAERTAVLKAVSEGVKDFDTIAIAGMGTKPYPCGACRQFLYEFSPDIRILVTDDKGNYEETSLNELLPHGFGPKNIKRSI